ncbi:MAG: helix-turn-helix transcriptional regulator [Microterricola sp.]
MVALTPLGIAALALLAERPMHPYEMYQLLIQRREDRVVKVRRGSLYHAVDRLLEQGLAAVRGTERAGNRPERTSYEITDAGRERLGSTIAELLATPVNEYPRFPLALGESHNLPRHEVTELLGARVALLRAELAEIEQLTAAASAKGVPRLYWIDADYRATQLRGEIGWLTATVADMASGALPWPDAEPGAAASTHSPN